MVAIPDREQTDLLDPVVLSTLEHLRRCGVNTPLGVTKVLGRATELLTRGTPPRPRTKAVAHHPESGGDCPRCGASSLTIRADRRNPTSGTEAVTRFFLACSTPECGYVES